MYWNKTSKWSQKKLVYIVVKLIPLSKRDEVTYIKTVMFWCYVKCSFISIIHRAYSKVSYHDTSDQPTTVKISYEEIDNSTSGNRFSQIAPFTIMDVNVVVILKLTRLKSYPIEQLQPFFILLICRICVCSYTCMPLYRSFHHVDWNVT